MAKGKLPLTNLPNWLLTLLFLIAVIGQNIVVILIVIFIGVVIYIQFNQPKNRTKYNKKPVYKSNIKVSNKKKSPNNPEQIYNKEYYYGGVLHFEHEKVDFRQNNLIEDHVKHLPYEKSASMYVSKLICDEKTNYNLIKNS